MNSIDDLILQIKESQNMPNHIAIIMDGNRRWARKNLLSSLKGHEEGINNVQKIVNLCFERLNISYLTLFAFSSENWKRSAIEINHLKKLISNYLSEKTLLDLKTKQIEIRFIGEADKFGDDILLKINKFQKETSGLKFKLIIAMNYGGQQEIILAVNKIINSNLKKIDSNSFREFMFLNDLPDPDLLIRTGGEKRISNFLLWYLAYTELWFTEKMWPEFCETDLLNGVLDSQLRGRRYGAE